MELFLDPVFRNLKKTKCYGFKTQNSVLSKNWKYSGLTDDVAFHMKWNLSEMCESLPSDLEYTASVKCDEF